MLTIRGKHLPGGAVEVWYIEAFAGPVPHNAIGSRRVIPHKTEPVESAADGRRIRLRSRLEDGVVVDHEIRAGRDEVDFRVVATNPTRSSRRRNGPSPASGSTATRVRKAEHVVGSLSAPLFPLC